jgi:hypothetical protein
MTTEENGVLVSSDMTFERVVRDTQEYFQWVDISEEEWREYLYPDGSMVRIDHPVALSLSHLGPPPEYGGGSHRIVTAEGLSKYVPRGWILLTFRASPCYSF